MRKQTLIFIALIVAILAIIAGVFVFRFKPSISQERQCVPNLPNYPAIVYHGSRDQPSVALTFDDWGSGENFQTILRILREKNVKATFFVNGYGTKRHPEFIRMVIRDKHLVGNHTFSHKPLTHFSAERARDEILRTHRLLKNLGIDDRPYFRYPFSDRNKQTDAIVRSLGYSTFFWDVNSGGAGKNAKLPQEVHDRVVNWSQPGSIVLMHIGSNSDIAALPSIIDGLRARDLEPVRLDELFTKCWLL